MNTKSCLGALFLLFLISLGGCRVEIKVPSGGQVLTESGNYDCYAGQTCSINVEDTNFDEKFTAIPDDDHHFVGWRDSSGQLCGPFNTKTCALSTKYFVGNDALLSILKSDDVFHLEPVFIQKQRGTQFFRQIEDGQKIQFKGTTFSAFEDEEAQVVPMSFTQLYRRTGNFVLGRELIESSVIGKGIGNSETSTSTVLLWQEETGSIYAVLLDNGYGVYDTATELPWILTTPSPLVPNTRLVVPFLMFDVTTELIVGEAETTIEISDKESVSVPMGNFDAFKIMVTQVVDVQVGDESGIAFTDIISWIVPEIGLIKQSFDTTVYIDDPDTEVRFGAEMEAISAN